MPIRYRDPDGRELPGVKGRDGSGMGVKNSQRSAHLFTTVTRQQPDEAGQLLVEQGREVEQQGPEQQRQDHEDEGVGHEFLGGGHDVQPEGDLVAVIFQTDAVETSQRDIPASLPRGEAAGTGGPGGGGGGHGGRISGDELVDGRRAVGGDMVRRGGGIERLHFGCHCDNGS